MLDRNDAHSWEWLWNQWWGYIPPWRWTGEMEVAWNLETIGGSTAPTYYEAPVYESTGHLPEDVEFEANGGGIGSYDFFQFEVELDSSRTYITEIATSGHTALPHGYTPWAERWRYFDVILEDGSFSLKINYHVASTDVFPLPSKEDIRNGVQGLDFLTEEWAAGLNRPRSISGKRGVSDFHLEDWGLDGDWDSFSGWISPFILSGSFDLGSVGSSVGELPYLSSYDDTIEYAETQLRELAAGLRPLESYSDEQVEELSPAELASAHWHQWVYEEVQNALDLFNPDLMIDG